MIHLQLISEATGRRLRIEVLDECSGRRLAQFRDDSQTIFGYDLTADQYLLLAHFFGQVALDMTQGRDQT